ncbi:MAG: hypothetical protein WCJ39_01550 [bacterium]
MKIPKKSIPSLASGESSKGDNTLKGIVNKQRNVLKPLLHKATEEERYGLVKRIEDIARQLRNAEEKDEVLAQAFETTFDALYAQTPLRIIKEKADLVYRGVLVDQKNGLSCKVYFATPRDEQGHTMGKHELLAVQMESNGKITLAQGMGKYPEALEMSTLDLASQELIKDMFSHISTSKKNNEKSKQEQLQL